MFTSGTGAKTPALLVSQVLTKDKEVKKERKKVR